VPSKSSSSSRAGGRVLAFDIGGSHLKAAIVDRAGKLLSARQRIPTPPNCTPTKLLHGMQALIEQLGPYDKIAIAFPGYVRDGVVRTAPNLGTRAWAKYPLASAVEKLFGKPTRLLNDADVQGLAVITGRGLELVCTLGTGFGTAWFRDGELMPHMEFAHIMLHGHKDIDAFIGDKVRRKIGNKKWNKRIQKIVTNLEMVMNYDHLYLGGGNAERVTFALPDNVSVVANEAGLEGGAFVWFPRKAR
jgi:polyphosphate glucokinase